MHNSPKHDFIQEDVDETEYLSYLIKDNELLEKYNEI